MDVKSHSRRDATEDSIASGTEGRNRRKFQRAATDTFTSPRKQHNHHNNNAKVFVEQKPNATPKRKSILRDHKLPQGPRPFDQSPSKRNSTDVSALLSTTRSQLPMIAREPIHGNRDAGSKRGARAATKGPEQAEDTDNSIDFLPSINFDDFHSSLTSNDLQLHDYPTTSVPSSTAQPQPETLKRGAMTSDNRLLRKTSGEAIEKKSLLRRLSNASRQGPKAQERDVPPTNKDGPTSFRSRLQDQSKAPTRSDYSSRTPRKSVGPGLVVNSAAQHENRHVGMLGQGLDNVNARLMRSASVERRSRRRSELPGAGHDAARLTKPLSNQKLKVTPTGSRSPLTSISTQPLTPDQSKTSLGRSPHSPGPSSGSKGLAPSTSSGRRQSVVAPHVSGLGARTISPTDARRLKRLSLLPGPPPLPHSPTTPQPISAEQRSATQSPLSSHGKSLTPLSAYETPDGSGKSFASRPSLSSNSSVNSVRVLSSSSQSGLNQVQSSSRIPTPKPKPIQTSFIGHETDDNEEEVPPVPAIPKAYESPKELLDQQYAAAITERPRDEQQSQSIRHDYLASPTCHPKPNDKFHPKPRNNSGTASNTHPKGSLLTDGPGASVPSAAPAGIRKSLQPLRLPPLNLLPLSTPTATRISSFRTPTAELDQRDLTPPPKRGPVKTPSTPMTASKATFFPRGFADDQEKFRAGRLRSTSSNFTLRTDPLYSNNSSSSAFPMPISTPISAGTQVTTPFTSNSLPKGEGDSEYFHDENSIRSPQSANISDATNLFGGYTIQSSQPRDQVSSTIVNSSEPPSTPNAPTSLRRKLSLGWRRGSSKMTHRQEEEPAQSKKQNDMPPPKLPASATWAPRTGTSPSPPVARPTPHARRRKSSFLLNGNSSLTDRFGNRNQREGQSSVQTTSYRDYLSSSDRSTVTSTNKRTHLPKDILSISKARSAENILDPEDLLADDDMKKLASKRKDFETAAKELDLLRSKATPKERGSAYQALQMVNLNIFERGEIIDYKEIYFCGTRGAKKHVGDLNASSANFGYDDERGDYNIVVGDHLSYRFEVIDILGKGSFGQVVRCIDHKTGSLVAVKIIRNKKRFHQQALVEVNILKMLREWDPESKHSMVNFTNSFYFRGHLCISTELLDMNLYEFIKAHDFRGFPLRLIRRFTKQILSSLILLKSHRVIHCDLKPENILLAHPLRSEIKVIDFGSSCFENEKVYTYIQSRFYRSPEVILGMTYGLPIDMWSMGCILAELLTGYPIFPGENEQEQLACVMEIFGPPEKHLIEKSTRRKLFFDSLGKPRVTVSSKGRRRRPSSKTLQQALKCDDEAFLDFISRCLRWDPDRRLKPEEALNHDFVTGGKKTSRIRQPINGLQGNTSPVKRTNSTHTPSRARPLPEPPVTSFKSGVGIGNGMNGGVGLGGSRIPSNSPIKAGRRHSTVDGLPTTGLGMKKLGSGIAIGSNNSNLPRAAPRSVSGKPDMASAAALASVRSR